MAFTLTPATADDFIGRKEITSELVTQLSSKNKIGYSISGIRRIGKTSILKEVSRRLADKKIPVIYISIWRVSPNTVDEFVKVLNRASIAAFQDRLPSKFKFEELLATGKTALARFLQGLKLSTKVTEDLEVTVSYVRRETIDVDAALSSCFSLIEHLGEMTGSTSVLIIDEFPSLTELAYGAKNQKIGDSVIKLIRTLYEEFKHTKLVVSGSYRLTLRNLVAKENAPFYKQLLIREIEPFSESEYHDFLNHYLPKLKFSDERIESELYHVTSGIPYNLQLIGTEIQLESIDSMDMNILHNIVKKVLKKGGELSFKEFTENFAPSEIKVLKALSKSPEIKPSEIAAQQFMDKDTAGYSLNLLTNKGVIIRTGRGAYQFTDNLFAEWLKTDESL